VPGGWHEAEESSRWTSGPASVWLRLGAKVDATLMHVNPTAERFPVSFTADGTRLGDVMLERGTWTEVSFDVPQAMRGHVSRVTISPERTWSPAEHGTKDDLRTLGVSVRKIASS
jgi:hypothetical protein